MRRATKPGVPRSKTARKWMPETKRLSGSANCRAIPVKKALRFPLETLPAVPLQNTEPPPTPGLRREGNRRDKKRFPSSCWNPPASKSPCWVPSARCNSRFCNIGSKANTRRTPDWSTRIGPSPAGSSQTRAIPPHRKPALRFRSAPRWPETRMAGSSHFSPANGP